MQPAWPATEGEAKTDAPASAPVDIVVFLTTAASGTLGRLRAILRHATGDFRLVVVDDATADSAFWSRVQRLARKKDRVLLLRNSELLGFSASINTALDQAEGRDIVVMSGDVRVFAGFLDGLRRAVSTDARSGLACPLSNRMHACREPAFADRVRVFEGHAPKRFAKLIRRAAPRSSPELFSPSPYCSYVRASVFSDIGRFDISHKTAVSALREFAEIAKTRGYVTSLAPEVFVLIESDDPEGDTSHNPSDPRTPTSSSALGPRFTFAEQLAWHERRKTAFNMPAPLVLLEASPFFGARPDDAQNVRASIVGLGLARVVLAYPASKGIELAEVIDGDWSRPLFYQWELSTPLASFVPEHAEAEAALLEILRIFQVSFVHLNRLELWLLACRRAVTTLSLPLVLVIDEDDATYLEELPTAVRAADLAAAHRVIFTSKLAADLLFTQLPLPDKRVVILEAGAQASSTSPAALLGVFASIYRHCAERAPRAASRWRSRDDLQRLGELRKPPGALVRTHVQVSPPRPRRMRDWLKRLRASVPKAVRKVTRRLPYPAKQQRKPR